MQRLVQWKGKASSPPTDCIKALNPTASEPSNRLQAHTRIKCQNGKNAVESTVSWQSDQGYIGSRFDCSTTLRS
ncbi:hypothetical protein B0H12DRAFT_1143723, partial [Mycena haematopus]